jgi:hypothetical protein
MGDALAGAVEVIAGFFEGLMAAVLVFFLVRSRPSC